ncbi:selenocysteine-specific translation factor, partial [Paraburkholderia sp. SIMBA_053]
HLAIIELLGIPLALVAISKCDRVAPVRVAEVQVQIAQLLAPGPYAGAAQFPLSSVTGEGVEALRHALLAAGEGLKQRS